MTAVVIVRSMLTAFPLLTEKVEKENVFLGVVPIKAKLPAIGITEISSVPRNTIGMHEKQRVMTSRVQITITAKTNKECKEILALVAFAMHSTSKANNVLSVIPDLLGPDIQDVELGLYQQSFDYKVSFIWPQ